MTTLQTGDLAVVTGPLKLASELFEAGNVYYESGVVVKVLVPVDEEGDVLVAELHTGKDQYIDAKSLTPLSEIQDDPDIEWGEVHDYVYEEGE